MSCGLNAKELGGMTDKKKSRITQNKFWTAINKIDFRCFDRKEIESRPTVKRLELLAKTQSPERILTPQESK